MNPRTNLRACLIVVAMLFTASFCTRTPVVVDTTPQYLIDSASFTTLDRMIVPLPVTDPTATAYPSGV